MSRSASPKDGASLADQAYDRLRRLAITYRFRPGERLSEVELAKRLKVSRTPVREALHRLAREGLVGFVAKRGFQGRFLDAKEVFDLYELRRGLELTAVRLAVTRAEDDDLAGIEVFLERSRAVSETSDPMELVELDEGFHEQITQLSGNAELLGVLRNVNARIRFCRWIDMVDGRRATTQSEHAAILDAITARDEERALALMGDHIERRLDQIVNTIREGYARIYMGTHAGAVARNEGRDDHD
jgi:DNA-binding GntR family transcriptional regulator